MIEQAFKTVRTLLPNSSVTVEQIEYAVNITLNIPQYKEIKKEELIRKIEEIYSFWRLDSSIIERNPEPWLKEKKSKINWGFWNRYRHYLEIDKTMSHNILFQIENDIDKTLDKLFDPTIESSISKYGLVVGQVQSGKTSNYTGLICKAADAGFKLIIVLAGIHNNLRSQTQQRLDEGFLGFNTRYTQKFDTEIAEDIWVGVGKISKNEIAHSITSCRDNGDFSKSAFNSLGLNFNTSQPIIAVVKKNSKVLERLLIWLSAQSNEVSDKKIIRNKSLLMIDDEADNASINTNRDGDKATKINGLIRDILRLFDKSAYVGYTATPFANLFIPIEDDQLFPRDFIINIPAPSNYIGPDKIFGIKVLEEDDELINTLPIVNRIGDYESLPNECPESLKIAIKCFILTCAIRRLRGQKEVHNSMLVHISRLIAQQKQIKAIVESVFNRYSRGIEFKISSIIEEFKQIFECDFEYNYQNENGYYVMNYKSYQSISQNILNNFPNLDIQTQIHNWEDVKENLWDAASRIIVKEINGGSGDVLNYFEHKKGLSVIAVGGDKLSRGLTLEGLSVSYYFRASKMYDTLMQMGRWFGYRKGYVDLCRLFTSRELNEWFCHITLASEELINEFNYMADVARSTPEQYVLKVRTHPGVLQISATNKIRRAEYVDISWSGRLIETYQLQKNIQTIELNYKNTINLINELDTNFKENKNNYLWKHINSEIIKKFLSNFKVSESINNKVNPNYLADFINISNRDYNELHSWNVAIITTQKNRNYKFETNNKEFKIGLVERNETINDNSISDKLIYKIRKNHIINPTDEFVDLDISIQNAAKKRSKELNPKYNDDFISGEVVRNEFRNGVPLLILYFLKPSGANFKEKNSIGQNPELENLETPIIGFAISFPQSKKNPTMRFAVHEQLLPLFNIDDENEEDNDNED